MKRLLPSLSIALTLVASIHAASPEEAARTPAPIISTDVSGGDLAFFSGAVPQTELLIRISALAAQRAEAPEVKALAQTVGKEQADASARLKSLAESVHIPLAQEPDGTGMKIIAAIAKLKGPRFDKAYLDALGDAHDPLKSVLQQGAASGVKEIREFATVDLAALQKEEDRVRKLEF